VRDAGGLAGDALPVAIEFGPGVGKAAAKNGGLAVLGPLAAIDAGDHDAIAEGPGGDFFGDQLIGRIGFRFYMSEELVAVAQAAIGIDLGHVRREDFRKGTDVFALFGAVPDSFERQNLAFVFATLRFLLREDGQ
jgi:hypothetical protein